MNHLKYYIALFIAVISLGCAEDKGNYDYTELNDIIFAPINAGEPYYRSPQSELIIEGKFTRKRHDTNEGLSYAWIIGRDTVSRSQNLSYTIPDGTPYGTIGCRFSIEDSNGMHYWKNFSLNVVSSFNYGYYILCKNSDNTSTIYYLSSLDEEAEFIHTSQIGPYVLGNNPSKITGAFGINTGLDAYVWTLYFCTQEGEYPMIETNSMTLLPSQLFSSDSFIDQTPHFFAPQDMYSSYLISDGQLVTIVKKYLYRPARHNKTYYWTKLMEGNSSQCVYDKLTNRFYVATPEKTDPEAGTVGDQYAYDRITDVANCPDFSNRSIIAIHQTFEEGTKSYDKYFITTCSNEGILIDTVAFDVNNYVADFKKGIVMQHENASNKIRGLKMGDDWYFAIGKELYTSPDILHKLTKFVDLPTDLGEVKEIAGSTESDHISMTFYDPTTGKGSFAKVWLQSKKVDVYPNVMSEPISLFSADGNPWW